MQQSSSATFFKLSLNFPFMGARKSRYVDVMGSVKAGNRLDWRSAQVHFRAWSNRWEHFTPRAKSADLLQVNLRPWVGSGAFFSRRRSWEWDRSRSWVDACWSILFKQIDTKDSLGRKGSNLPPGACSSQFKWNREKRSWAPDNFLESEELKNSYDVAKEVNFNLFAYFGQVLGIFYFA